MNTTVGNDYTFSFTMVQQYGNQTTLATMGPDDFVKVAMSVDNGGFMDWEIHKFYSSQ
jgi:hypothetical protein